MHGKGMLVFVRAHKKLQCYLILLAVLWCGAIMQLGTDVFDKWDIRGIGVGAKDALKKDGDYVLWEKEFKGEIGLEQRSRIANAVLEQYGAKLVERVQEEGVFSVYGYSDTLLEPVVAAGERINLNVISYYDEVRDKTVMKAASPIFGGDY